jgi:DNA-binding response OmpR family regulator
MILLDVMMPTMTGFGVSAGALTPPEYIILLTALEDLGVRTMGEKAGATTTIRKPFDPEHIVEFLDKRLGRPPGPPRL